MDSLKIINRIKDLFYDVAIREDGLLRTIAGTSIFHMPELAFAYQCGKELAIRSHEIFEGIEYKWIREKHRGRDDMRDTMDDM